MIKTRNRRLFLVIILLLAVSAVFVGVWHVMKKQDDVVVPEEIRDEKLNELELRAGEYDEYSIVLSDTSLSAATALAKQLDAKLRITSDGSFATLTLIDGRTIKDIYGDDAYLQYIDSLSTDWQATVGRYHNGDEEHKIPSAPTSSQSNKAELREYLDYLNLSTVWNTTMGQGTTVAIIDTGIDTDHPEFSGRISEYSYNATEDKIVKDHVLSDGSYDWSLVEDEVGHGTAVAGAFAASMNGAGMVGVAPQVTVIVIKAECNANGTFARTSDLVFGLYYAIERDASVVNMSFGTYGFNPFSEATQLAYDSDVLCVAAAGNDGTAALCYPAADEYVIGVGALSEGSWELAAYSNYGENVDVVAPGTVYTAVNGGGYSTMTGTSLASPLVAGVISLLSSTDKYITFDEVYALLVASSRDLGDLGHDYYFGYGAIDASALLLEERGTITYDMMTNELDDAEGLFVVGHTLQEVLAPERLYAIFDGWYYDPYYTEEYVWYEDAIYTDITVYAKWENEDDGIPYTYVELEDGMIEIRSYTGRRRYITIPEYIDGKPVTSIGDFAFDGQSALREIKLPSGLKHIGLYAFRNCSNLHTISIPSGVTELEAGAFYGCIRLSTIAFVGTPQLQTIGTNAFALCSKLSRVEIPANVTSIGAGAFYGDISLMEIAVQRANTSFTDIGGVLFNATKSTLLAYPAARTADYTIPDGTTTVAAYAFAYAHLGKIDLNQTSFLGNAAFESSYLLSVSIPDSVRSMGSFAFANCARLSAVAFGENTGLTTISASAFAYCSSLQTIAIPNAVTEIGGSAFSYAALRSITFGTDSRLISIGGSAFFGTPLQSIALPKSLITIGGYAFSNCWFLSAVTFGENSNLNVIGSYAFANTDSLTAFAFPGRLTQLGDFAFLSSALEGDVTIPASLSYLGAGAFASCQGLESIFVHADNATYCDRDGVVYTKDGKKVVAYPAGNERISYPIAEGVETVAAAAFYGAGRLQSVTLPESLVYLEEYAFAYVIALSSVAIPDGVMQIGRYAFLYDMAMSAVTFGENCVLPRIGFGSFAYCGITSITVPKNVSTIAQGAFMGCDRLVSATFAKDSKLQSISAYLFDGATNLQTIKFEKGSALTSIQAHGLEGLTKLTSVDFGDARLTNIDNFAFRFCESLTSFSIPSGVTNVGRYAFYGCYGLNSVSVPASVE